MFPLHQITETLLAESHDTWLFIRANSFPPWPKAQWFSSCLTLRMPLFISD